MKRGGAKKSGFSFIGAVIFFCTVALIIQAAVLTYDFITTRTQNRAAIAVGMLAVTLFLASLCTVIDVVRRKIMVDKPVDRILLATEKIAVGDFSVQLQPLHPYGKYDEFDVIMQNLNTMTQELAKTKVLQSDFVSNVSHELKTPLSVIQSYAILLESDDLDEETRKKYAETVAAATKRLSSLVTGMLKLNKLENQQLRPETELVDLTAALAEDVAAIEEVASEKGVEISCDLDEVEIVASRSLLEIVWNNLLSNAVKFTPAGSSVFVGLKRRENQIELCVSDTGCGISPEVGAHIFEKFYQGDTSHAAEGNGLGLALVKRVVDILGGTIRVSSKEGEGSTFTLVLEV